MQGGEVRVQRRQEVQEERGGGEEVREEEERVGVRGGMDQWTTNRSLNSVMSDCSHCTEAPCTVAPCSASPALATGPLVAQLVGVALLVLALARVACAFHQPTGSALAAVVALLAPGVSNLSRGISGGMPFRVIST